MMAARRGVTVVRQIVSFARGVTPGSGPLDARPLLHDFERLLRHLLPRSISVQSTIPQDLPALAGDESAALSSTAQSLRQCPRRHAARRDADAGYSSGRTAGLRNREWHGPTLRRHHREGQGCRHRGRQARNDLRALLRPSPPATARAWDWRLCAISCAEWAASCVLQARSARAAQFTIYWPVARPERGRARRPGGPRRTRPGRRQRSFLRRTARAALETYGYRTAMAHDAGEALAHLVARGTEVNVVVIDGATSLTAQEVRAAAPRACVLGLGSVSDCTVCIEKPYSADDLLRAVSRALALADRST